GEVQTEGTWRERLHKWREILGKERLVDQLNSSNAKYAVEFDMKEVENSLRKDVAEKATATQGTRVNEYHNEMHQCGEAVNEEKKSLIIKKADHFDTVQPYKKSPWSQLHLVVDIWAKKVQILINVQKIYMSSQFRSAKLEVTMGDV
ncbi:ATP-dependent zinc metalloprotease ftsh chloroplastic-like, partial [Trifolium pratense]